MKSSDAPALALEEQRDAVAKDLAAVDHQIARSERLVGMALECGFTQLAAAITADLETARRYRAAAVKALAGTPALGG